MPKSVALSRDEVYSVMGVEAAEELTASAGVAMGVVGRGVIGAGVVDAKRTPTPFSIMLLVREGIRVVRREVMLLERSGLARMGPCCTEEENWRESVFCDTTRSEILPVEQKRYRDAADQC